MVLIQNKIWFAVILNFAVGGSRLSVAVAVAVGDGVQLSVSVAVTALRGAASSSNSYLWNLLQ